MARPARPSPLAVVFLLFSIVCAASYRHRHGPVSCRAEATVGEAQIVHPDVSVAGRPASGNARLAEGQTLETGPDGRARVRLDDATEVFLDRSTRIVVGAGRAEVTAGRALVRRAADGRVRVLAGDAVLTVASATVGVDVVAGGVRVFCASGELSIAYAGRDHRVATGETAAISGGVLSVAPERSFLDFTSGLAAPWGAKGPPRPAMGELWGRGGTDEVGAALVVRRHDVAARLDGESAITTVSTTYFNGGSAQVSADFRMAVPEGALVSRFAIDRGDGLREAAVAIGGEQGADAARLEWAGEGWVRGALGRLDAGRTLTVVVAYVEWLPLEGGRLVYRYPLASAGVAPSVGDFRARVDASALRPRGLRTRADARVDGAVVELARSDFRPVADLVVEAEVDLAERPAARAYVARGEPGDPSGDYLLVRADVPPPTSAAGASVAIVIDTSASIDAATLDTERALVTALVDGLGSKDRVVVLAADQSVRPLGPDAIGPVDAPRRDSIRAALRVVEPGGASDLGLALERAADAVRDDPAGVVIYAGDGWPTVSETSLEAIRLRLERRRGGLLRLFAVAAGPAANRLGLAAMVHGIGAAYAAVDRDDAASLGVTLLTRALTGAAAAVELDLGPGVARVFPRSARPVALGEVATTVGRLAGARPESVVVRRRDGARTIEERLSLAYPAGSDEGDVRRRWGQARLAELSRRGDAREAAVDVARRVGLLTPWTGFAMADPYLATSPEARLLVVGEEQLTPPSARLATQAAWATTLDEGLVPTAGGGDDDLARATEAVVRRQLDDARTSVRACRDARAAQRPSLAPSLRVTLRLGGDGRAKTLAVRAGSGADDASLDRCAEAALASIAWPASGLANDVSVDHELVLPTLRDARPRGCSAASTLPLPVRRGVWRERLAKVVPKDAYLAFLSARSACELGTWTDARVLLDGMLRIVVGGGPRIALARQLADAAEPDAAAFVRREAIRRATTPDESRAVRLALLGDERPAARAFAKRYADARTDDARLREVRRFLVLAPHDDFVRRRWLSLLERRAAVAELRVVIGSIRQDPLAGAPLLADAASALRRLGDVDEARRAFGELVERAPLDPFAHAYLGDRLRDAGLFDEAAAAYEALARLTPGDPPALVRLALAYVGSGRVDLATRELARAGEDGGRQGDERLATIASVLEATVLADARPEASDEARLEIDRRAARVPLPSAAAFVLVRAVASDEPLRVTTSRERGATPAPIVAPSIALALIVVERGDRGMSIRLSQPPALSPFAKRRARVDVVVPGRDGGPPIVTTREVDVPADASKTSLRWDGSALVGVSDPPVL